MDLSRLPPLSSLRAFEAAARLGSVTAAGRELNVTHAAVSQQLRRLEQHLGTALVRRRGRGLELTEAGRRLAGPLGEGFATIGEAVARLLEDERARPLKITLTPMFAATWLLPRLGAFREAHPGIELMLDPTSANLDLKAAGHDLAIRYGDGRWPGLESRPLLPSRFVVVVAKALLDRLAAEGEPDIRELPWLQEQGTDELRHWLARRGVDVGQKTNIIHLPGYMTLTALRDGQGVAATTRVFVEEDIRAGRLVVLYEDLRPDATAYHLAWPKGDLRPAARAFVRWATAQAQETPAPGAPAAAARAGSRVAARDPAQPGLPLTRPGLWRTLATKPRRGFSPAHAHPCRTRRRPPSGQGIRHGRPLHRLIAATSGDSAKPESRAGGMERGRACGYRRPRATGGCPCPRGWPRFSPPTWSATAG